MTATACNARVWECSSTEYHADTESVSRSELEIFINSEERFYEEVVQGNRRPPTKALDFGSMFHDAVLGNGTRDDLFVEIPESALSRGGSRAGEAWMKFKARHRGKVLLKAEEFRLAARMLDKLHYHDMAAKILNHPRKKTEFTIRWTHGPTEQELRSRLDLYIPGALIGDLKTTKSASPDGFRKEVLNHGYHRQAAFYRAAVEALTGKLLDFVFIAIEKASPYRVEAYQLDDDFLDLGRRDVESALLRLQECIDSGKWQSATHGQIVTLSAPRWALASKVEA
jgi:hypothetical protein